MSTGVTTTVDFLLQRLDEDEATARNALHPDAVSPGAWVTEHHNSEMDDSESSQRCHIAEDRHGHYWSVAHDVFIPNAEHMARHDPARVLREIAARRAIIVEVQRWNHDLNDEDGWYSCSQAVDSYDGSWQCSDDNRAGKPCDCGVETQRTKILGPIAAVYSEHPDYDPGWKA